MDLWNVEYITITITITERYTFVFTPLIYPVWSSYYVLFKNRSNRLPYGYV